MAGDLGLFLGQLLRRPHQVVALAPSSTALAAEMAVTLDPAGGPVIELGAGTGKITRAILDRGLPPGRLHAVEMNESFCDRLRAAFPGVQVHKMSAADIATLDTKGPPQAVVSGLPLLSMPLDLQRAILTGTFAQVGRAGRFIQFTYGPKPPVARAVREDLGLLWSESPKVWWNLPPARVYRFRLA